MSTGAYADWIQSMRAAGAAVGMTWPFPDQYQGLTAARFDSAGAYANAFNAGMLNGLVQQSNAANTAFYVVAPSDVQDDSPQTMTAWERFLNAGFTYGDQAAAATGLPSLNAIEHALNPFDLSSSKLLVGVGAIIGLWLVLPSLRRK